MRSLLGKSEENNISETRSMSKGVAVFSRLLNDLETIHEAESSNVIEIEQLVHSDNIIYLGDNKQSVSIQRKISFKL